MLLSCMIYHALTHFKNALAGNTRVLAEFAKLQKNEIVLKRVSIRREPNAGRRAKG